MSKNLYKVKKLNRILYARRKFKGASLGYRVAACKRLAVMGSEYMKVGDYCYFGPDCRIEAWAQYLGQTFSPLIELGKDVRINSTCHIGAINRITIGEQCLLGSNVFITDHAHGKNTIEESFVHPSERELYSKGPVTIGARCWIGENVVILPNVSIGEGCVIGANAVVTKDIPSFSVAAGNPAKVVKTIK